MSRLTLFWPITAFWVLVAACDPGGTDIGVTLSESGTLTILYDSCKSGRLVKSVELETADTTLWRIAAKKPSDLREFVVGEEPEGFETTVALTGALDTQRLRVSVSGVGPEFFSLSEIEPGMVFVHGDGNMTFTEFSERDTCR